MIIDCGPAGRVDTALLSPQERHIIQKVMAWHSLADSLSMFREKVASALAAGWNNSGPVRETAALTKVIAHFEKKVRNRLSDAGSG